MALPAPLQELWSTWNDIQGTTTRTVRVNLIGPAGDYREALRQLMVRDGGNVGCLRVSELSSDVPPEADLHLVMLDPAFGPTSSQVTVLRKITPQALVLVMVGGDEHQFEARRREVAAAVGVRADHVIAAKTVPLLRPQLAKRMIDLHEELTVPLARQFPFLRDEAGNQEIHATSQQNAMVGAMPIPGADLPLMTANQVKMVLRLAAMYNQPITMDRLKEVLAVVGGGFAFRSAARQIAKFIPGPGWVVAGALGYGGTQAMGRAAVEYFKRGALAPASGREPSKRRRDAVIDTEAEVVPRKE